MREQHCVGQIGPYRCVDLSTPLRPVQGGRLCEVERFLVPETQDYHSHMHLESHLGTHVESPFHFRNNAPCIGSLPFTAFMGRGVRIECTLKRGGPLMPPESMTPLRDGNVPVLWSRARCEPFEARGNDLRPQFTSAAAFALSRRGIKAVALADSVAIENDPAESLRVHEILMDRDILLLEVVRNVEHIKDDVFLLMFQPLPIAGLDSCPVRVVAIEGVPGFRPDDHEERASE